MSHRCHRPLCWRRLCCTLCALWLMGCGSSSEGVGAGTPSGDSGPGGDGALNGDASSEGDGDASPPTAFDSNALINNPVEQLFADAERNPLSFPDAAERGLEGYTDIVATCYAGPDECESSFCAPLASCCVATGSCCAPLDEAPLPESVDFGDCSGQRIEACADAAGFDADPFGSPLITARGLVPNGTATERAGALLGSALNLANERVSVEVEFAQPIGCNGSCLESAGVGFTPDTGDGRFNGTQVALLLSGSRERVSLLVGEQVVDDFDSAGVSTTWRLLLSPTGSAEVQRDGATLGVYPFDAASLSSARLAVFGRSLFSSFSSAAISRLAVVVELCDNPRGWTEREAIELTLDGESSPDLAGAAEPSLLDERASSTVAFELDGEIYLGQMSDGVVDVSSLGAPLVATESFESGGIGEPELFAVGETLHLYYTAFDTSGAGSIGVATIVDGDPEKDRLPALVPGEDAVSYESPTVRVRDGLSVLVVRATLQSGTTELRAFYSSDPATGWVRIVDGTLEALTRAEEATEDVTAPSLIVHNSAYQLYYSRRIGTRWTVEVVVSEELLFWRPLGEALGPSGGGFDSLGARGLDARSGLDEVDALYMGQGPVSFGLGHARRPAPSTSAMTAF